MQAQRKRVFLIAGALILIGGGCSKKEEEAASGATTSFTSTVNTNLSKVSADFAPESLSANLPSEAQSMSDDNPCEGTNGLVDCQPNLLKLYLAISKQQLDMLRSVISEIGQGLGQLPDGASGSRTEDGETIEYSKTSGTVWSFTLKRGSTTFAYIGVNGSTYTLEIDLAEAGEDDGAFGKFESVVQYTDENNWSLTNTMLGGECSADDVRAPQNVRIVMAKAGGLWKGKAMMYHPRWAVFSPEPTCATTPDDDTALNLYSDFVGDNEVAKMNVYMLKRTRAANEITSHPLSDFCNEYALCSGGVLGSETLSNYPNSVCIESDSGDGIWNSDCSAQASSDSNVPTATFGSASDWVAPTAFFGLDITVGQ